MFSAIACSPKWAGCKYARSADSSAKTFATACCRRTSAACAASLRLLLLLLQLLLVPPATFSQTSCCCSCSSRCSSNKNCLSSITAPHAKQSVHAPLPFPCAAAAGRSLRRMRNKVLQVSVSITRIKPPPLAHGSPACAAAAAAPAAGPAAAPTSAAITAGLCGNTSSIGLSSSRSAVAATSTGGRSSKGCFSPSAAPSCCCCCFC